jgi:hypothetical protein
MPLQGTFDVLDFAAVLDLLATRQMTGRLRVWNRSFAANLFFEQGRLVGADQSEHQAAAVAGDVRSKLRDICLQLMQADRGTFEFQPGRPARLPGTTPIDVSEVLDDARQRLIASPEIPKGTPSVVADLTASDSEELPRDESATIDLKEEPKRRLRLGSQ